MVAHCGRNTESSVLAKSLHSASGSGDLVDARSDRDLLDLDEVEADSSELDNPYGEEGPPQYAMHSLPEDAALLPAGVRGPTPVRLQTSE